MVRCTRRRSPPVHWRAGVQLHPVMPACVAVEASAAVEVRDPSAAPAVESKRMPAASPLSPSLGKRVTHSSVVPVVESPRRTTLPSAAGGARRRSFMETAMGKLGGAAGPGGGSDGVVVSDVGVMYERFMEALRAYKPLSEAREREEVRMCVQCVYVCVSVYHCLFL